MQVQEGSTDEKTDDERQEVRDNDVWRVQN